MSGNKKIYRDLKINGIQFSNTIIRSSIGGRMANMDGEVTDVWKNFELRFAQGGVGGIVSTTFGVDEARKSPHQYPSLAHDKYIPRLKQYINEIQQTGCRYIIQIGDPGYHTQTSLLPEPADSLSASSGVDLVYGYNNRITAMDEAAIEGMIQKFIDAAIRVQKTGADGLEITASKGYLIHQFLCPAANHRDDAWGGDAVRRLQFLKHIIKGVREALGPDFPVGLRIAAEDRITDPRLFWLLRVPWRRRGNDINQMLACMRELAADIDYLHVTAGFGFPNPHVTPGRFPTEEINLFFNQTRHLSAKAWIRSALFNILSRPWGVRQLADALLFQPGWEYKQGNNLHYAHRFKQDPVIRKNNPNLKVIANGGFQNHAMVESALARGECDAVSMARALIANPDLINSYWQQGKDPEHTEACSYCNRCVGRSPTSPLGCYDVNRFPGENNAEQMAAMRQQIEAWNRQDDLSIQRAAELVPE